jgi:hypothetical protein
MRNFVAERGEVSRDARMRMGRRESDTLLDYESRDCIRAKHRLVERESRGARLVASSGL